MEKLKNKAKKAGKFIKEDLEETRRKAHNDLKRSLARDAEVHGNLKRIRRHRTHS